MSVLDPSSSLRVDIKLYLIGYRFALTKIPEQFIRDMSSDMILYQTT